MKIRLRNPTRELDLDGPRTVAKLLNELAIVPESVIVIRNGELVTKDAQLASDDTIEVRAVTSGGAG